MGLLTSLEPGAIDPQLETLLEFRAGRMVLEGTRVHADPRKGLIRVVKADDSLVHFQWWDLLANVMEEDQIVFPEEATFEKVSQSSGRVYILKFRHDHRRFFYWMQGSKVEEDEQLCESVKYHLNQPLDFNDDPEESAPQPTSGEFQEGEAAEASSRDVNMVGFIDQLPSLSGGPIKLADLQRVLHGLERGSDSHDVGEAEYQDTGPSFNEIFKPDMVLPLLDPTSLQERLGPYLPEGVGTPEAVAELMQSPHFQRQLDIFTHVLRSGQLDWAQFGINPSNYNFTVASFLEAIEDQTTGIDDSNPISVQDNSKPEGEHTRKNQKDDHQRDKNDKDLMEEGL